MKLDGLKQAFLRATDSGEPGGDDRFALWSVDDRPARYDGAWWPRSRDLIDEFTRLLAAVDVAGRGVTRVSFATRAWDPAPRRMTWGDRLVRLTGFTWMDDRLVTLTDGGDRLSLMVIPSATEPDVARRALQNTGEPIDAVPPCIPAAADEPVNEGDPRWENEGGYVRV